MDSLFHWMLAAIFVWMLYMLTFRTKDFIEIMKSDQDRRDRSAERMGKAAKGLGWLLRLFFRK